MVNPNILSARYATLDINAIFSEEGKILAERDLWLAVMKSQRELGLDIPEDDIQKFEDAKEKIDLKRIREIERVTKHDVKAKIEAYVEVAGTGQYLHRGMTSRDLTDNVEQMQIKNSARIIFDKNISVLRHMLDNAKKYQDYIITARTHHQPAQPTLLGRRFSMWAEELLFHLKSFESFIDNYPLRGIKGAVGTQFDMLTLFKGDKNKVVRLEELVAEQLGFTKVLNSVGQVYPRSFDYTIVNHLAQISSGSENFAKTMRLMAGFGLVDEGFEEGQSGSTAMPYKMNTKNCERICGLANLLKMYADGASRISGDQWQEGDVSCSVPRRVIIPDAFYTADGLAETVLTVLNGMNVYEGEIIHELDRYLPFMATTEILQRAVSAGVGREDAHKIIKGYAVAEAKRMKTEGLTDNYLLDLINAEAKRMKTKGSTDNYLSDILASDPLFIEGSTDNDLLDQIAGDPLFIGAGITRESIQEAVADKEHFVGDARNQITRVVESANEILNKYPNATTYEPRLIL